ncbi:DUF1080 domain-containing protein [bacterium]|nr:DUF1080 domain-containing protein [bacterium]
MNVSHYLFLLPIVLIIAAGCSSPQQRDGVPDAGAWAVHDPDRPLPKVVTPGVCEAGAPADAIILFDGGSLDNWQMSDGAGAAWKVAQGYMEVVKGTGTLQTRDAFGDCQLHIEWAAPAVVEGDGQGRGNSGVFLMGIYEVQVLDSYDNKTYADGQAAAVYGQYPPLVNACRPPGEWQSYDIIFHGPRFDKDESLLRPATMTVIHNGVLVQDHVILTGPTAHKARPPYKLHPEKLPLSLQDHGNPVRFRNIWIRELE